MEGGCAPLRCDATLQGGLTARSARSVMQQQRRASQDPTSPRQPTTTTRRNIPRRRPGPRPADTKANSKTQYNEDEAALPSHARRAGAVHPSRTQPKPQREVLHRKTLPKYCTRTDELAHLFLVPASGVSRRRRSWLNKPGRLCRTLPPGTRWLNFAPGQHRNIGLPPSTACSQLSACFGLVTKKTVQRQRTNGNQ
jgi:hypothetical protein